MKKNSKWNKIRIIAQSCQGKWILFLDLDLEQDLFLLKAISLQWKTLCISFSHFKAFTTHHLADFPNSESLFTQFVLQKEFAIFLFLSIMSDNMKHEKLYNNSAWHFYYSLMYHYLQKICSSSVEKKHPWIFFPWLI